MARFFPVATVTSPFLGRCHEAMPDQQSLRYKLLSTVIKVDWRKAPFLGDWKKILDQSAMRQIDGSSSGGEGSLGGAHICLPHNRSQSPKGKREMPRAAEIIPT